MKIKCPLCLPEPKGGSIVQSFPCTHRHKQEWKIPPAALQCLCPLHSYRQFEDSRWCCCFVCIVPVNTGDRGHAFSFSSLNLEFPFWHCIFFLQTVAHDYKITFEFPTNDFWNRVAIWLWGKCLFFSMWFTDTNNLKLCMWSMWTKRALKRKSSAVYCQNTSHPTEIIYLPL